ncbi:radical SAM protein [Streptomyces sp. NWU339]|uniref:radical SAM protein n=1 Tax=Streptomyces sp. NWU339 TaxID=2185284 RepID=UPI000D6853AD|nr:radical SAM protein [Streptomyces sp. NWU339]PWI06549.1 radical SAM protein [Streptomyces sp. NWU339]
MAYEVLVAPFLDKHLLLRPGEQSGATIPAPLYVELRDTASCSGDVPQWLADTVRQSWDLDIAGRAMVSTVLVRDESPYGYCRASYELNLGCNFDCAHCYLAQKRFEGLDWQDREKLLTAMRDAGVVWLQMTGGEPMIDRLWAETYRYAYDLGMMLSVSTNASVMWKPENIALLTERRPYRVTVSVYGASEESFDGLTKRRGSFRKFQRGVEAALAAGLTLSLNLIITESCAHEEQQMIGMAEQWGLPYHVFSNMSPTIYGGAESLPAQSKEHLRERKPFGGCHAGHTFFHSDPHGRISICKVGRDEQIDLVAEGVEGLTRLGRIADRLMLRTGGCSGCALSGSCRVCRPLAKLYQEAKAPLQMYCQHAPQEVTA